MAQMVQQDQQVQVVLLVEMEQLVQVDLQVQLELRVHQVPAVQWVQLGPKVIPGLLETMV